MKLLHTLKMCFDTKNWFKMRLEDLNMQPGDLLRLTDFYDQLYVFIKIDRTNLTKLYVMLRISTLQIFSYVGFIEAEFVFQIENAVWLDFKMRLKDLNVQVGDLVITSINETLFIVVDVNKHNREPYVLLRISDFKTLDFVGTLDVKMVFSIKDTI